MPLMWGTLIGTFAYNYFVFYAMSWLPSYFVEQRHVPLTSSGLYSGFSYGGMAAMAILGGLAADWWIARGGGALATRRAFVIAGLLVASTEVFGAFANTLNGALFFSIISMAGLGFAHGELLVARAKVRCPRRWPGASAGRTEYGSGRWPESPRRF